MKKTVFILITALLLSLFAPCIAATAALQADGSYIVKLADTEAVESAEDLGLEPVYADAGLYRADSLKQVKQLDGDVDYYEKDTKAYLIGDVEVLEDSATAELLAISNDKYASRQWSLTSVAASSSWSSGYTGSGVKLAIIDSGVRASHEDLQNVNIVSGYNTLNGSTDITDQTGHGTMISSIIGATVGNSKGIAGLIDDVTIVPIKCFGSDGTTDSSYIVKGIYKAVDDYDVDVINLSLGLTVNLQSMKQAIDYATGKGVIVVSATGNNGTTDLSYPAAYQNVIGVGSITSSNTISSFSQRNDSVFVVAPGSEIYGCSYTSDTGYARGNGTSYSAPHVAAAAAIVKQYTSSADTNDFMDILRESASDMGASGYDTTYGYGSLNLKAMISAMKDYDYTDTTKPVEVDTPDKEPDIVTPEPTVSPSTSPSPSPTPSPSPSPSVDTDKILAAFTDVSSHWAYNYISYCVGQQYFNGVTASKFEPEWTMTRGMYVTVLARMSGVNVSGYYNTFSDVSDSMYYAQPIAWAEAKGIIDKGATFRPDESITRETMATYLYRFAVAYGYSDGSVNINLIASYDDYGHVSSWAVNGMAWAVKNGIINGRTQTTLCPQDTAKRAEVSAIFQRFDDIFKK